MLQVSYGIFGSAFEFVCLLKIFNRVGFNPFGWDGMFISSEKSCSNHLQCAL